MVNKESNVLERVYRKISIQKTIPGEGPGLKQIKAVEKMPTIDDVKKEEARLTYEKGKPVNIVYLNAKQMQNIPYT